MSKFAIATGIYSYVIFFLGVGGVIYFFTILSVTLVYVIYCLFLGKNLYKRVVFTQGILFLIRHRFFLCLLILLILLAVVNLIGVLGPELGFDALWYHLTIPKIFLLEHKIFYISGGLLYYSVMPKLAEMLYVAALSFGDERVTKAIHYLFGILSMVVLYKISRKYLSPEYSLLTCLLYYSNLLVLWESTSSYIDLIWTFFETVAVWCFLSWQGKKQKFFYSSAVLLGFAISTKLLAIRSLGILSALMWGMEKKKISAVKKICAFALIAISIPMPWFIFAYVTTGNPLYPLFSAQFQSVHDKVFSLGLLNPVHILTTLWTTFTASSDPLSPIYLMFAPLVILTYSRMKKDEQLLVWFVILGICVWYVTSGVEGARLLLPYLPILSLVTVIACVHASRIWFSKQQTYILFSLLVVSVGISLLYRVGANAKYLPYVLGKESKAEFMKNHLDFSFGDFYDVDGYFAKYISAQDRVLLIGFHNLYYVNFPFIDQTWLRPGDRFNYIATQNASLPKQFSNWKEIYINKQTHVSLFTNNKEWVVE